MKRGFSVVLVLTGCLAVLTAATPALRAQAPVAGGGPAQKPTSGSPANPPSANPFPDDTSTVPVLPAASSPAVPVSKENESASPSGRVLFSSDDLDPVRSPDDLAPEVINDQPGESSSSLKGLEGVLPRGDEDQPTGRKKLKVKDPEPTHEETAKEDVTVGGYYLEKKNWKAAQSRFQSAMVLDPEDPEVYWGLAESAYHLGDFASARQWYMKLLDYDPDGPHGKQARKAVKDPAVANAVSATPAASAAK